MPDVGDPAPDLTLSGPDGDVRLGGLWRVRPLVLAFYTEDNTPLCSSEIGMLRDDFPVIQELGAGVVAVSADSGDSHADFLARIGSLPFPLLSDTTLEAARAYGVLDDAGRRSRRAVFVIGTDGLIVHAEPWFQPGNPSQYEAVFRALGFEA